MSKYYIDTDNAFPTRDMEGYTLSLKIVNGPLLICDFQETTTTASVIADYINKQMEGVEAESDSQRLRIICDKDFNIVNTPPGLRWASFKPLRMADKPKPKPEPRKKSRPKPVMPKISKRDED